MGSGEWEHNLAELRDKERNSMANFQTACDYTLDHEDRARAGRIEPEPCGGKARFGVNSLAHPEMPPEFWTMPAASALPIAEQVYRQWYWQVCGLDACNDQALANKVMDCAFWMGVNRAGKWAQTACNTISSAGLVVDGHLGPKSWASINAADPLVMRKAIAALCASHVEDDCKASPAVAAIKDSLMARADELG